MKWADRCVSILLSRIHHPISKTRIKTRHIKDITGLKLMDYINSSGRYTLHYFTPGVWGVGRVMMIFSDLCSYKNAVTFQENLI